MNARERKAVENVIAYNWLDELRDYEEQDDDGQKNHIFKDLQVLVRMTERTPGVTDEIVAALEGDSNDAEHDALVAVAQALGLTWCDSDEEASL